MPKSKRKSNTSRTGAGPKPRRSRNGRFVKPPGRTLSETVMPAEYGVAPGTEVPREMTRADGTVSVTISVTPMPGDPPRKSLLARLREWFA